MIDIFYRKTFLRTKQIKPNGLDNTLDKMNLHMTNILNYYRYNPLKVKSTNTLYKILNNLPIHKYNNIIDLVNNLNPIIKNMSIAYGLSDEVNMTVVNSGIINKADELIYSVNNYSLLELLRIDEYTWQEYTPLVMINHSMNDLYCNHPLYFKLYADRPVVYTLDITLMCVMYLFYIRYRKNNDLSISIGDFLSRYVFTNVMKSMYNISVLNILLDKGEVSIINKHPFSVSNVHSINDNLERHKKQIPNNTSLLVILKNLYLPYGNAYDMLMINKSVRTTNRSDRYIVMTLLDFLIYVIPRVKHNTRILNRLKTKIERDLLESNLKIHDIIDKEYYRIINTIKELL